MSDLFSTGDRLEKIELQGGEVYYQRHLEFALPASIIMDRLRSESSWREENITVWGKTFVQPRLVAWYGDASRNYSYSGIHLKPQPWTELLWSIKLVIEQTIKAEFNSVLLNYYRDNRDSMGFHSDDERELGPRPTIASLSLGEERVFILKSKTDRLAKPIRLRLESGSLLVMRGDTQQNWKHGIAKEARRIGPRLNLTFRHIYPESDLLNQFGRRR